MKYLDRDTTSAMGAPIDPHQDPASISFSEDSFARPGYRRAIHIVPQSGRVCVSLEDDLHGMSVELEHDGTRIIGLTPEMTRAPWSPCSGAIKVLQETFTGLELHQVTARKDRQANCTHLHDLAILSAAYAHAEKACTYSIAVTDPIEGERVLEVQRDGQILHRWLETLGILSSPPDIAGLTVLTLRDWITDLSEPHKEAARLLQWAGLVSHGRTMSPLERHTALHHSPNCYTMQPERVITAQAASPMMDFSRGTETVLGRIHSRDANT